MSKQRALFLDRDGVINEEIGYLIRREDVRFMPGIFELCRTAVELNYLVIVVTNQAGIARGYYTEAQFGELTNWMRSEFRARGSDLAAVYFCPYHEEFGIGPYKRASEDRKPNPGMILKAARDLSLDLSESILVGDKESDLQAATAAGVGSIFLLGEATVLPANSCLLFSVTKSLFEVRDFLMQKAGATK